MNTTAVISIAASVASIVSLGYAVAIRKVDDTCQLLKILVREPLEVELLGLIEQTVSDQVAEKTKIIAKQEANGRLDENLLSVVVLDVCSYIESEHSLTIEDKIWVGIEHSLPTHIEEGITTQRARKGLALAGKGVQNQVKKAVVTEVTVKQKRTITNMAKAEINSSLSDVIREESVKEIDELLIRQQPITIDTSNEEGDPVGEVWEFSHNEGGYREWVRNHPQGFIINTYQPDKDQSKYMMLHKAKCYFVTNFDKQKSGAFTCGTFMKVCADEVAPLRGWVQKHGRPDGLFTGECKMCNPVKKVAQPNGVQSAVPSEAPHPGSAPLSITSATQDEQAILLAKCQALPPAQEDYLLNDYVENLLLTVVDFMLKTKVVKKAQSHYLQFEKANIRTHEDLKRVLSSYQDTQEGNTQLAQKLWGYNLHTRAQMLRRLVAYFESVGVTDQKQLSSWAENTQFEDFAGKVKGAGYAIFQWLVMRQGVETIKPDVHVLRFVNEALGHPVTPVAAVSGLEQVAKEMNIKAYELDWRIWESQLNKAAGTPAPAVSALPASA